MYTQSINSVAFNSHLKTLYKKGRLNVERGLYGELLTKKNVTDEHIICKCFGGGNDLSNIALASKELNNARGNQPIENFITIGMLRSYLKQFRGVKCQGFDGDCYIKGVRETSKEIVDGKND